MSYMHESVLKTLKHCINIKDDHTRMWGATNEIITELS